jgi:hypothetical protein
LDQLGDFGTVDGLTIEKCKGDKVEAGAMLVEQRASPVLLLGGSDCSLNDTASQPMTRPRSVLPTLDVATH